MPETYTLAATPFLFSEGQFKGELKGITFTATSRSDTKQWFTINCGQFSEYFGNLISASDVKETVAALVRGDHIDFPGMYHGGQLDGGFAYVHNGKPVLP